MKIRRIRKKSKKHFVKRFFHEKTFFLKKTFFFIFFFIGRTCVFLQRIFSSDRELPAACAAALLTWHTKVPGYRQGSRNARTRVFARISCPAMKKDAVCQVFISPGRPGKTHFCAAMRRSSDLGEPSRVLEGTWWVSAGAMRRSKDVDTPVRVFKEVAHPVRGGAPRQPRQGWRTP